MGELIPVGKAVAETADVRLVAATNANLPRRRAQETPPQKPRDPEREGEPQAAPPEPSREELEALLTKLEGNIEKNRPAPRAASQAGLSMARASRARPRPLSQAAR